MKRQVFAHAEGTWSLSPTGDAPTVRFIANRTWTDVYPVPGDEGSQVEVYRGLDLHVFGARGTVQIAGLQLDDGETHGVFRFPDDPRAAATLCLALGA